MLSPHKTNENRLKVGDAYILLKRIHCLKKGSSEIDELLTVDFLDSVELRKNNLIVYFGEQKAKNSGSKYCLIMNKGVLYYTYNLKRLQGVLKPL